MNSQQSLQTLYPIHFFNSLLTDCLCQKTKQPTNKFPHSINQLKKLLPIRNEKFFFSPQNYKQNQTWLCKKGGNMALLKEDLKALKDLQKNDIEKKNEISDCYYYIQNMGKAKQEEYLAKNFQYGVYSTIQNIMVTNRKEKGNLVSRLTRKKGKQNYCHMNNTYRIESKRQKYISLTCQNIGLIKKMSSEQLLLYYQKIQAKIPFIPILKAQLLQIGPSSENFLKDFARGSLKILEKEFDQRLPKTYESVLTYLASHYLHQIDGRFFRNESLGPVWGVAYLLFQAGRMNELKSLMSFDKNNLTLFHSLINEQKNVSGVLKKRYSTDVFFDQLCLILEGSFKYSSKTLCKPDSLDIAWIILYNAKISSNPQKYSSFLEYINECFENRALTEDTAKILFYLGSYEKLIEFGPNDFMDKDDMIHFLLVLIKCPALIKNRQNIFRKFLTDKLQNYIYELFCEGKKESIKYMLLIPDQFFPDLISSLHLNVFLFENSHWQLFKENFPLSVFEQALRKTISSFLTIHNNNIEYLLSLCSILNDDFFSMRILAQVLINSYLSKSLKEADSTLIECSIKLLFKNNKVCEKYLGLFQFLKQYQIIKNLLKEKNSKKIYEHLKTNFELVIFQHSIPESFLQFLQLLQHHKGFQLYLEYLSFYCIGCSLLHSTFNMCIKETYFAVYYLLQTLFKLEPFKRYEKSSIVENLSIQLQSQLGMMKNKNGV